MNNQEIFDKVVTALRAQGKQAKNGVLCKYRAADGSKCAFGHLIPDEYYRPLMEGKLASSLLNPGMVPAYDSQLANYLGFGRDHGEDQRKRELISHLQSVHDGHQPRAWEDAFARCAQVFDLVYTPPAPAAPAAPEAT